MISDKKIIFLVVLYTLLSLLSCGERKESGAAKKTSTADTIQVSVDETIRNVMEQQKKVFDSSYPNLYLNISYKTEYDCFDDFLNRKVPLIITARDLSGKEQKQYKDNKFFYKSSTLAEDGLAVIVHPSSPDSLMTIGQLQQILKGRFARSYNLIFDHQKSSIVKYVLDSLIPGEDFPSNAYAIQSKDSIIKYISQHKDALAIVPVAYVYNPEVFLGAGDFLDNIKVVSLLDEVGGMFYQPYQAYLAMKNYPLRRTLYFIINERGPSPATTFANFLWMERGQLIFNKSRYVPLHAPINIRETQIIQ